jgi:hypothetical protein
MILPSPFKVCVIRTVGFAVVFLAVSLSCFAGSPQTVSFCKGATVPLVDVSSRIPVSFSAGPFTSTDQGSNSSILIVNRAHELIVRALVIVEFRDERSERLLGIVHYFHDEAVLDTDMERNFSGEGRFAALVGGRINDYIKPVTQSYRRAIKPGETTTIAGVTNITATVCPASAIVTGVAVEYKSGKLLTDFAAGWHLDPEIGRPLPVAMQDGQTIIVQPPLVTTQFRGNVRVNQDGCGSLSVAQPNVIKLIGTTVRQIPFLPAMVDGKSVTQDVAVFFLFHRSTGEILRSWDEKSQLPELIAVLHLWEKDGHYVILDLDYPHKPLNCPVQ